MDWKKIWDSLKESQKPENVKQRLRDNIEIGKLKLENEKINAERKKMFGKRIGG